MKNLFAFGIAVLCAVGTCFAAQQGAIVNGEYVITVAAGDPDVTLNADDATALGTTVNLVKKELTAESILKTTCQHFNIKEKEVQGKSRKADIVQARQVSMFLCHKYTDLPLSGIGRIIGRRDHSTVAHSCNLIASRIATDKKFRLDMEELESKLKKA